MLIALWGIVGDPSFVAESPIVVLAGNGIAGNSGDGGFALQASLNAPHDVAVDSKGNIYIADTDNRCIRKVDPYGIITTIIGIGTLVEPTHLAVDRSGNLYIADRRGGRIYKWSQSLNMRACR